MDHKLIDQALNKLLFTKAVDRTAEQIQGFAHLVCSAAGVAIDLPTQALAALPELHAAATLLATQLDTDTLNPSSSVTTTICLFNHSQPLMAVYFHNPHGFGDSTTVLSGCGGSAEEVMRTLQDKAYDICKPGAE